MTFRAAVFVFVLVVATLAAFAQQGTAPNGNYPRDYLGTTFTGEVVAGPLDVLTLRYKKGAREEIFSGRFETPCTAQTKDGKWAWMSPADVALGNTVTVFYYGNTAKASGKSETPAVIFRIRFDVVGGKVIPLRTRSQFNCTQQESTGTRPSVRPSSYNHPQLLLDQDEGTGFSGD